MAACGLLPEEDARSSAGCEPGSGLPTTSCAPPALVASWHGLDQERKRHESSTTRAVSTARIVSLALIGAGGHAGSRTSRFAPDDRVSVPGRRRPVTSASRTATTPPRRAATKPTAARSSCPRTGTGRVATDRAAGDTDPRPLRASERADLPPRRRSRHDEHAVREREPVRRRPRRRPCRLPRHGRFVGARLSRGRFGDEALDRPPRREVVPRARRRFPRLRGPTDGRRRRSRRLQPRRSGSTISRPRARRSATAASTSSARAPGRARR